MNKNKRLKEIQSFLGEFEFKTKVPDFIGAWASNKTIESFNEFSCKSYMLGYTIDDETCIVLDILGISEFDNPFMTKGVMIQKYDQKKCHSSIESEIVRYYPDNNVKKSEFDKRFLLINQFDGDYITGEFDLIGENTCGVFIIMENDRGPLFERMTSQIEENLSLSLKLL